MFFSVDKVSSISVLNVLSGKGRIVDYKQTLIKHIVINDEYGFPEGVLELLGQPF